jgi:hypothetical protein
MIIPNECVCHAQGPFPFRAGLPRRRDRWRA